jgi:ABC-type Fe3+-hydroxamate transport system substrate-binding protein
MQNDTPKKQETRKERFIRVATRRTNDILNRIRILGNCSNKSAYDYTDEDIQKIFAAFDKELRIVKARFNNRKKNTFHL